MPSVINPEQVNQIFESASLGQTINSDEIREKAREINVLGEQDPVLVEQHLYKEAATAAVEKHIKDNCEVSLLVPTFFYRLQAESRKETYFSKPILLPALEKGTMEVGASIGKAPVELVIDEEGLTVPGWWINPKYDETHPDSGEHRYTDGEKLFKFPTDPEQQTEIIIGRHAEECDVAVSLDPNWSRRHLIIRLNADRTIEVVDISSNLSSISYKGTKTREQTIKDLLKQIGTTELIFEKTPASQAQSAEISQ